MNVFHFLIFFCSQLQFIAYFHQKTVFLMELCKFRSVLTGFGAFRHFKLYNGAFFFYNRMEKTDFSDVRLASCAAFPYTTKKRGLRMNKRRLIPLFAAFVL